MIVRKAQVVDNISSESETCAAGIAAALMKKRPGKDKMTILRPSLGSLTYKPCRK